jgi:hypothetical protein
MRKRAYAPFPLGLVPNLNHGRGLRKIHVPTRHLTTYKMNMTVYRLSFRTLLTFIPREENVEQFLEKRRSN